MNIIMSQCNFTEETYEPSRDTAVFNVQVRASRPTVSADSSNALISDSPPSPRLQTGFVGALVAGVACGIAMML
jgi:predicted lipid-binding transport protein (Tim44 family)